MPAELIAESTLLEITNPERRNFPPQKKIPMFVRTILCRQECDLRRATQPLVCLGNTRCILIFDKVVARTVVNTRLAGKKQGARTQKHPPVLATVMANFRTTLPYGLTGLSAITRIREAL